MTLEKNLLNKNQLLLVLHTLMWGNILIHHHVKSQVPRPLSRRKQPPTPKIGRKKLRLVAMRRKTYTKLYNLIFTKIHYQVQKYTFVSVLGLNGGMNFIPPFRPNAFITRRPSWCWQTSATQNDEKKILHFKVIISSSQTVWRTCCCQSCSCRCVQFWIFQ